MRWCCASTRMPREKKPPSARCRSCSRRDCSCAWSRCGRARMWLQAEGCDRVLNDEQPDSVLLLKILEAEFRADEPPSVNAWLATLDPGEEAALSGVLEREVPPEAKVVAEDCWHELERRIL